ncbi:YjcZ family sporulation protein [Sporolactobacillus sp. KGMB 08714]
MEYDDGSSCGYSGSGEGSSMFALIVVLFILLIIVGTAFVY